jgi:acyl-CoA thioesterase
MAAIAVRFAEAHLAGRHVRTVFTSFLRPGVVGPASLSLTTLRASRGLTTHEVALSQDERVVTRTRITATTAAPDLGHAREGGTDWDDAVAPELAALEQCVALAPPPGVKHFDQAIAVLDPSDVPFAKGPLARVRGYVRPLEDGPIDAAWLTMMLDWFPPSPFSRYEAPVGGVSVDFAAHVHSTLPRLPDGLWLVVDFQADVSKGDLALERGRIFAPPAWWGATSSRRAGHLLAESFHTRWTR